MTASTLEKETAKIYCERCVFRFAENKKEYSHDSIILTRTYKCASEKKRVTFGEKTPVRTPMGHFWDYENCDEKNKNNDCGNFARRCILNFIYHRLIAELKDF